MLSCVLMKAPSDRALLQSTTATITLPTNPRLVAGILLTVVGGCDAATFVAPNNSDQR